MLPEHLRAARKRAKLTQGQVAKRLGFSRSLVSKHETGDIDPTASQIIAYCQLFRISADWLLGLPVERTTASTSPTTAEIEAALSVINRALVR